MERKSKLTIAIATAVLAVLVATAVYAQDKYSQKSPRGTQTLPRTLASAWAFACTEASRSGGGWTVAAAASDESWGEALASR